MSLGSSISYVAQPILLQMVGVQKIYLIALYGGCITTGPWCIPREFLFLLGEKRLGDMGLRLYLARFTRCHPEDSKNPKLFREARCHSAYFASSPTTKTDFIACAAPWRPSKENNSD